MPSLLPPGQMSVAERLDEVSEILAVGLARLQGLEPGPMNHDDADVEKGERDASASRIVGGNRDGAPAGVSP